MAMAKKKPDDGRVVAVVGATGAVGAVLLDVLAERSFPVSELRPLASDRSAGTTVRFAGRDLEVEVARPEAFDGADFAFFAATGTLSKELAPEVASRGGVAIDKSSTWRMNDEVPLVVPEINPEALEKHRGIVSCPNCTTRRARARRGAASGGIRRAHRRERGPAVRDLPRRRLLDRGGQAALRDPQDHGPRVARR
jgi:aspartate-semialdehyde dehydrogenase